MNILERFISYTRFATTSSDDCDVCPSNPDEFLLANHLCQELKQLGVKDAHVDEQCFVYGTLESNVAHECPTIGFLAHMDTSNATSGTGVKARVIENYDGKDIELSEGIYTTVADYPDLADLKGKTIVVTDGTTLLGGDDKAGIAIIMDFVQRCHEDPSIRHGKVLVCFTPDEETGSGIHHIDLNEFKPDYAYTVDGGSPETIAYECFNGASAEIRFHGNSIHPGSAKGKMINACQLAIDFHNMLPVFDRPENTEGREGFNHLLNVQGDCQSAESVYIIRNHDAGLFEKQKKDFEMIRDTMNARYGKEVVELHLNDTYRNMAECFRGREYIIDNMLNALKEAGYEPKSEAIRGGTDGSQLSFMGIPTPNLGTGDFYCHGNHELVCIDYMQSMVDVVMKIAQASCEVK
ncbi:MAG: peptidase T [Erysipelotrichaceae bacterium]|nr:peptidase T [Erysipelotrichaceae bacterium]